MAKEGSTENMSLNKDLVKVKMVAMSISGKGGFEVCKVLKAGMCWNMPLESHGHPGNLSKI